jgi:hypothetical protein
VQYYTLAFHIWSHLDHRLANETPTHNGSVMTYQNMPTYMYVPLLQMPMTAQMWMLYVFSALAALTIIWALYRSRVHGSWTPLLYCIGGGLTCFQEPIHTRLLDATHAQVGQQVAFEGLGQLVPWHAAISYTFYFGLAYIILIPAFKERRYTSRQIWMILLAVTVAAWVYEAPLIYIGLWDYYGEQPYQPFGLQPIYWSAASMAMLIVPTTLIAKYEDFLTGWRKILIVPLAPIGAMAAAAGVCWPIWVALNSPASDGVKFFAATLTIAFSFFVAWLAIPHIARVETSTVREALPSTT